ncbi:MAG TPA: hypothetical protein VM115_10595 [Vicinamibacterales bacterium]|nr:hypothetical protein [Vicinamibacterales bacterium]
MVVRHITVLGVALCILVLRSPAFAQLALPSNLHVAPMYQNFVASMADRSATFDAQLQCIASAEGVTVYLEVVPHVIGARARTRMVRDLDELTAWIEVDRLENLVELIAHEIEHVLEQIERISLTEGARMAETGIYSVSVDGTAFETARATRAGVRVAREVARSQEQDPAYVLVQ